MPSPVPFRHAFVPVSQLSGLAPRAPHIPMPHEFFQTLALLPSVLFSRVAKGTISSQGQQGTPEVGIIQTHPRLGASSSSSSSGLQATLRQKDTHDPAVLSGATQLTTAYAFAFLSPSTDISWGQELPSVQSSLELSPAEMAALPIPEAHPT